MKITVTVTKACEYTKLKDYNLIEFNGSFYYADSFTKNIKDGFAKILGCETTKGKKPRKLRVKIPHDKSMYETKRASPMWIYQSQIDDHKNNASVEYSDKKRKGKKYIGLHWASMDGTLWLYNEEEDLFCPIPARRSLEFSTSVFGQYNLDKIAEVCETLDWYDGHEFYQAHCSSCGGRTLRVYYQETEKTAGNGKNKFANDIFFGTPELASLSATDQDEYEYEHEEY